MRITVLLIFLAGSATAGESEPTPAPLLEALKLANENRDSARLPGLLERVSVKDMSADARDGLARELGRSLSVFRKNLGIEREVIKVLGELRSKRSVAPLKKFACRLTTRRDREIALQMVALDALGKRSDPKLLGGFEKAVAHRNIDIAKAAYTGLGHYQDAKARLRKRVTETLIKRLLLEYPAYSNSNGKWISDEKRRRWRSVSSAIVASLQLVSHESSINAPEDWRQWWKENKKKPWRDHPKG